MLYAVIWLVRQLLEARVVAANLGLHPLSVLAVKYAGLRLIGVAGLFVGPITLIAVQSNLSRGSRRKKNIAVLISEVYID